MNVHASSTTPTGEICIELIAVLVRADGTKIECRDTVCFHCDPAPTERCDSMNVRAFPNLNQSTRTFTIYNVKAPVSPICSVHVDVVPPPGGSGLHGSNLVIDGVSHAWPAGTSSNYTWITGAHGLPANSTVQFNLAVDYGIGWVGNVTVTVYHCDGTTCTMEYGPWDAGKGRVIDIGTSTDVPDRGTLHMHTLNFSHDQAAGEHIRSIAVQYNDPVTELVAVTGATYPCDAGNNQGVNCNDMLQGVFVNGRSMMIDLRRDLDDPTNQIDPSVTVLYRALGGENPTVDIIYYDENGQEVGHEQLDVTGGDPPGRIVSGLDGGDRGDRIAAMMGALTARPNPTSGRCDLGFTLPTAATVDLELIDARGNRIATVIQGERMAPGEHHRMVDMGAIASGTYLVTLPSTASRRCSAWSSPSSPTADVGMMKRPGERSASRASLLKMGAPPSTAIVLPHLRSNSAISSTSSNPSPRASLHEATFSRSAAHTGSLPIPRIYLIIWAATSPA